MNAVVLINKPEGLRSTKCVATVRKFFGDLKCGHAGTLDSTASGLLIILTGQATRLCEYVMSLPKVYRAKIQFGSETDTADYSGEIVSNAGLKNYDAEAVNNALYNFCGWRMQTPPPVSAIKIDGVPAYKLARSGQDPEMKARPVFFRRIDVTTPYNPDDGTMELEISCGRGTYIRSLAVDLGKISGCGAHLKSLVRKSSGIFTLDNADNPDVEDFRPVTLSELAENYTRIKINARDEKSFINGMSILLSHAEEVIRGPALIKFSGVICVEGDNFLGFGQYAGYDYVRPLVIVPKK